jgi:hypothetical protein
MNFEIELVLLPTILAVIGISLSLYSFKIQSKNRTLLDFTEKQIEDLQITMTRNRETFDLNAQRFAEQARRLAWVEQRVRQPKLNTEDTVDELTGIHETPKLNITERRHLVMSLSQRGQDIISISETLGMLPGEVELIINLNQMALNHI